MFGSKKPKVTLDVNRALRFTEAGQRDGEDGHVRRRARRAKKWAVCIIHFPNGGKLDGVLVDVSDTGARVRFVTNGGHISQHVRLEAPVAGINRAAELVWRDRNEAGFRYL